MERRKRENAWCFVFSWGYFLGFWVAAESCSLRMSPRFCSGMFPPVMGSATLLPRSWSRSLKAAAVDAAPAPSAS